MPAKPAKRPVARVENGEECMVAVCSWCGGPCPVHTDRTGNPWCKCSACGARSFGKQAGYTVGETRDRFRRVTWPPEGLKLGVAFG